MDPKTAKRSPKNHEQKPTNGDLMENIHQMVF